MIKEGEYFTIYLRRISDNKIIEDPIKDTAGGVVWASMINLFL